MRINDRIPVSSFDNAYQKAGWLSKQTKDGTYTVWLSPEDSNVWTMLPNNIESSEYMFLQEKTVLMLLFALHIQESDRSIREILSQLKGLNYKLISRIVSKEVSNDRAIPYEIATSVPDKNVDAFRYFYQTKTGKSNSLPIEKFEFNHTEVGSFVIPVSIKIEDSPQTMLTSVATDTNRVMHEYLDTVKNLVDIPRENAEDFAHHALSKNISSKIVKDFLGPDHGIAKYKEKYANSIESVSISGSGSYILDHGLAKEERVFKEINVTQSTPLDQQYISTLEQLEIASDTSRIEEYGAQVNVLVDTVHIAGKVIFEVLQINGNKIDRPFKAYGAGLTKSQLDTCADYFKERKPATIIADVTKAKGRVGRLTIETIAPGSMITTTPSQLGF